MDKAKLVKYATAAAVTTGMAATLPVIAPFAAPFVVPLMAGVFSDDTVNKLVEKGGDTIGGIMSNIASSAIWESPNPLEKYPKENQDLLRLLANAYLEAIKQFDHENDKELKKQAGQILPLVQKRLKRAIDAGRENDLLMLFPLSKDKDQKDLEYSFANRISSGDLILEMADEAFSENEILADEIEISIRRWYNEQKTAEKEKETRLTGMGLAENEPLPDTLRSALREQLSKSILKKIGELIKTEGFEKSWISFQRLHLQSILKEIKNQQNGLSKADRELLTPLAVKLDKLAETDLPQKLTDSTKKILSRLDQSEENIKQCVREESDKIQDYLAEIRSDVKEIKHTQKEHGKKLDEYGEKLDIIVSGQRREVIQPKGFVNPQREPNDFFVEQSNIFARLDEHLGKHHISYLHGTHGLGKTTTVTEYAYSRENEYQFIFYVLATDNAIVSEMAQLADRYVEAVLPDDKPEEKALKLKAYLEENARWEKESKNWLVIFDNLESKEPIDKYFPKSGKGDVLYTCNEKLYSGNDHGVDFEKFTQTEAELFLYQKVNAKKDAESENIPPDELKEIQKVIEALGKIPLALNIAGSYIRETGVSYDDYVELVKANINKHLKYRDAFKQHQSETLLDAYLISLEKIKEFDADDEDGETVAKFAETFLNLCSFCAPEDIPEELIKNSLFLVQPYIPTKEPTSIKFLRSLFKALIYLFPKKEKETPKIFTYEPKFSLREDKSLSNEEQSQWREIVALLKKFGLIKEKQKPFKYKEKFDEPQILEDGTKAHWAEKETVINVFDTYRTLQNVLSVKLGDEIKKSLLEKLILVLEDLLPRLELTTWEIHSKYVLHALTIIEKAKTLAILNQESWRVCEEIGSYLREIAQYTQAEHFLLRGKSMAEDLYGIEHDNTATSYNNLAALYHLQGRYEEFEPLLQKAFSISENVLDINHPEMAKIYNNLAEFYRLQDRYEEAESLYQKSLSIYENAFGENHSVTATICNNLAELYHLQCRYEESEQFFRKALQICESVLGVNHPDTALSYCYYGTLRYQQNKLPEALELCEKALAIMQNTLPENHPHIKSAESWVKKIKNELNEKVSSE